MVSTKAYWQKWNGKYYQSHKEQVTARIRRYRVTPKGRYNSYKTSAKARGIGFDLTFEEFMRYWEVSCNYCGTEIVGIGLDRIDNEQGYIKGNVVACCAVCNRMKLAMSTDIFLNHCQKILRHNQLL